MTENEKEKKNTQTVNSNIQHHPVIQIGLPDTSIGNFKRSKITQSLDTKKKKKKQQKKTEKRVQTALKQKQLRQLKAVVIQRQTTQKYDIFSFTY